MVCTPCYLPLNVPYRGVLLYPPIVGGSRHPSSYQLEIIVFSPISAMCDTTHALSCCWSPHFCGVTLQTNTVSPTHAPVKELGHGFAEEMVAGLWPQSVLQGGIS